MIFPKKSQKNCLKGLVFLSLFLVFLPLTNGYAVTREELQSLTGRMEADCAGIEPATRTLTDLQNRIDTLEATKNRNQANYDSIRSECGGIVTYEDCAAQNALILEQINQLLVLRSELAVETDKAQIEIDKCRAAVGASQAATGTITGTTGPVEWTSPIGAVSPTQILGKIIKTVLGILGAIALFMFVWGGLAWMTSGGSPEKIKKAQTTLVWTVLGMIVIFASYAAVDFVLSAFGV